jgi:hypothetical protein
MAGNPTPQVNTTCLRPSAFSFMRTSRPVSQSGRKYVSQGVRGQDRIMERHETTNSDSTNHKTRPAPLSWKLDLAPAAVAHTHQE